MATFTERIIFSKPGALVKDTGDYPFERPFTSIIHVSYDKTSPDRDYLFLTGSGMPISYPTSFDALRGSQVEGKIEFSSYGNEYVLREFTEEDSEWFTGFGLPLSPEMMEEIMAKDETLGISQAVEALTDDNGDLVGLLYVVNNLGTFSRVSGEWKLGSTDGTQEGEEDFSFTSTSIDLRKAKELVEKYDAGEEINEGDLKTYAAEEEEEDEVAE
jgi:hypothetical protein